MIVTWITALIFIFIAGICIGISLYDWYIVQSIKQKGFFEMLTKDTVKFHREKN